jgi:hypothetical protein
MLGATGNARSAREQLSIDEFPSDRLTGYRSPGTFFSIEIGTCRIAVEDYGRREAEADLNDACDQAVGK